MKTKLDSREKLAKIVKNLNEADAQRLLAFTAGMDIGQKINSQHFYNTESVNTITQ